MMGLVSQFGLGMPMGNTGTKWSYEEVIDRILIGVTFYNNLTFRPGKLPGAGTTKNCKIGSRNDLKK